jgi:hypothetical protein
MRADFHLPTRALFVLVVCLVLVGSARPQENSGVEDRIFFSKEFPGSVPPYFEVVLDAGGKAVYRESGDDEVPIEFQIHSREAQKVFGWAQALDLFRKEIGSQRKIAFTGNKVLRFISPGGDIHEARFSHTELPDAQEIVRWFERVAETERHLIELERVTQFDRLGINKILLLFQSSFDKGRVVAAQQFLPILSKIASDKRVVHIARARATALIQRIEEGAPSQEASR